MRPRHLVALAWCDFQPRTRALALALGGEAHFIRGSRLRHLAFLPFRYVRAATETWSLLRRQDPDVVLAVTSPVLAPIVAALWCRRRRRILLMDCHTDAFHAARWRWALPLHRWLTRRALAVLLHTEEDTELVRSWGAVGLLLPDDLPDPEEAIDQPRGATPRVVVAGSLDPNEPVAAAIQAASLLPDVEVRFTGDPRNIPTSLRSRAPRNVRFTGWLDYPTFLGELRASHVVAAFSTDPHIMNRAAFEAIACGRPLVLSDLPGLRARFSGTALFCANDPGQMAEALRIALRDQQSLAERSVRAQTDLRQQRKAAMDKLESLLQNSTRASGHRKAIPRVLLISQHPYPFDAVVSRNVGHLLENGMKLDVICRVGSDVPSEPTPQHSGLRVHAVRMQHRRTPAARYLLEYAAFFLLAFSRVCGLTLLRRYDVVQVDNPPDFLVFSALLPRLLGSRVVLNMYELLPEMAADRLGVAPTHWLIRSLGWLERWATSWADHVIAVSEPCRRTLVARSVPATKISVIPNTQPAVPSRPVRTPPPSPVLITHGTLLARYGVQVAIQAVAELQTAWPQLILFVLGEGEYKPALVELADRLGVSANVVFRGFVPDSAAIEHVRRATLGIVPILGHGYGRLLLPTKLLNYVQQGVPVVCSRTPTIEEYFPADTLAYFSPGDAKGLAAQVDALLRDPDGAELQASRASAVLLRTLSWETVSPRYLAALGIGQLRQPLLSAAS